MAYDPLVDRLVGNAYPTVAAVSKNINEIKYVAANMEAIIAAATNPGGGGGEGEGTDFTLPSYTETMLTTEGKAAFSQIFKAWLASLPTDPAVAGVGNVYNAGGIPAVVVA